MKTLDIARKDLLRSFRSAAFLAFGFLVPLLVTGLFYFAFGGLASGDRSFDVPATAVQVVNLDRPDSRFGNRSVGQMLVDMLRSPDLAHLLHVREATDAFAARVAVDRQEAGVAVILPAGLTAALLDEQGRAAVEVYHDPTLTIGPAIVSSLIRQFVDGLAGSKIAATVAMQQLSSRGVAVSPAMAAAVAQQYAAWAQALGESRKQGYDSLLAVRPPTGEAARPVSLRTSILGMIMAGMISFYTFFTGASSAQSLLEEAESGTLARLFTTPTAHSSILGGRILATYALLMVQTASLVVASALIFGLNWGRPISVVLVALGMIVLAASFGLFITSLLKNSRQGGMVYGGLMTVMGMVGMIGIFASVSNASLKGFDVASLLVPQGWAVRGWQQLLAGGGVRDVLVTVAVMLVLGGVFFALGLLRFRRRFA